MDNDGYQCTRKYWNEIFSNVSEYDVTSAIEVPEIEAAINWITDGNETILDYGCGRGRMLFRCIANGVKKGYGIDISDKSIGFCTDIANKNNLNGKLNFILGSIESLESINENSVDGVILGNILDNLIPEDSLNLLNEVRRILKPKGKILLIMNPYLAKKDLKEFHFKEIQNEFYEDENGVFFWNLSDGRIEDIIMELFSVERSFSIYMGQQEVQRRVYFLRNEK